MGRVQLAAYSNTNAQEMDTPRSTCQRQYIFSVEGALWASPETYDRVLQATSSYATKLDQALL